MSKITHDGLTPACTGCFIAVPNTHVAAVRVKGLRFNDYYSSCNVSVDLGTLQSGVVLMFLCGMMPVDDTRRS